MTYDEALIRLGEIVAAYHYASILPSEECEANAEAEAREIAEALRQGRENAREEGTREIIAYIRWKRSELSTDYEIVEGILEWDFVNTPPTEAER